MKFTPDKHLHSREHLLADDLSRLMLEPKKFAAYLGVAKMYYEPDLRALAKHVAAKRDLDPKNRGKYFFGALRSLQKKVIWLKEVRKNGAKASKAANPVKTDASRLASRRTAPPLAIPFHTANGNRRRSKGAKEKNGKTANRKIAKQRS